MPLPCPKYRPQLDRLFVETRGRVHAASRRDPANPPSAPFPFFGGARCVVVQPREGVIDDSRGYFPICPAPLPSLDPPPWRDTPLPETVRPRNQAEARASSSRSRELRTRVPGRARRWCPCAGCRGFPVPPVPPSELEHARYCWDEGAVSENTSAREGGSVLSGSRTAVVASLLY